MSTKMTNKGAREDSSRSSGDENLGPSNSAWCAEHVRYWSPSQVASRVREVLRAYSEEKVAQFSRLDLSGELYLEHATVEQWLQTMKLAGVALAYGPCAYLAKDVSGLLGNSKKRKVSGEIMGEGSAPKRANLTDGLQNDLPLRFQKRVIDARKLIEDVKKSVNEAHLVEPGRWQDLPFPFIGRSEHSRFVFAPGNTQYFEFMGRSELKTFQDLLAQFLASRRIAMNVQGTMGAGKSHFIAAAVCWLLKNHRVLYLPDCDAFAKNEVSYLQSSLAVTIHDKPYLLRQVGEARSLDDLKAIMQVITGEMDVVFVFDQWNALETGPAAAVYSEIKDLQRIKLRKFLHDISDESPRIFGSSANDLTFAVATSWCKPSSPPLYTLKASLDNDEAESWWAKRFPSATADQKKFANEMSGKVPLWLQQIAAEGVWNDTSPAITQITEEAYSWIIQKAMKLAKDEQSLLLDYLQRTLLRETLSTTSKGNVHLFDHRFVTVGSTGMLGFTCPMALHAAIAGLRKIDPWLVPADKFVDVADLFPDNASVQGYALEAAVLAVMQRNGAKAIDGEFRATPQVTIFSDAVVAPIDFQKKTALYIPQRYNFPNIDAIYVRNIPDQKSTTFFPIQITLDIDGHRDSEVKFYNKLDSWKKNMPQGTKLTTEFIWIGRSKKRDPDPVIGGVRTYKNRFLRFSDVDAMFTKYDA